MNNNNKKVITILHPIKVWNSARNIKKIWVEGNMCVWSTPGDVIIGSVIIICVWNELYQKRARHKRMSAFKFMHTKNSSRFFNFIKWNRNKFSSFCAFSRSFFISCVPHISIKYTFCISNKQEWAEI